MSKRNLIGEKFGRLTPIEATSKRDGCQSVIWRCICDCGNETFKSTRALTSVSGTRSCGCIQREKASENIRRAHKSGINSPTFKHGQYRSRIYSIWLNMKARCTYKKANRYNDYGGRGIFFCTEWEDFIMFYNWANSNGYRDDLSLDRIDPDGNYEPNNCRWVTTKVQNNNKRNNNNICWNGKTQTLQQWADELNINYKTLQKRIRNWGVEKAFNEPLYVRQI